MFGLLFRQRPGRHRHLPCLICFQLRICASAGGPGAPRARVSTLAVSLAVPNGGEGEAPTDLPTFRLPADVRCRGVLLPYPQRPGRFLRASLPKGRGSFSFSADRALPLAIGLRHLACPPARVRLRDAP